MVDNPSNNGVSLVFPDPTGRRLETNTRGKTVTLSKDENMRKQTASKETTYHRTARKKVLFLVALVLAVGLAHCGGAVKQTNFAVPQDQFYAQVKSLAVIPDYVYGNDSPPYFFHDEMLEPGEKEFASSVDKKTEQVIYDELKGMGNFSIKAKSEAETVYEDLKNLELYSGKTGEIDEAKLGEAVKDIASKLGVDGILLIGYEIRMATVSGRKATCDGVPVNIESGGKKALEIMDGITWGSKGQTQYHGDIPCISLTAMIIYKDGTVFWEGAGGVDVTKRIKNIGEQELTLQQIFEEKGEIEFRVKRAVQTAFKSLKGE